MGILIQALLHVEKELLQGGEIFHNFIGLGDGIRKRRIQHDDHNTMRVFMPDNSKRIAIINYILRMRKQV